MNHKSDYVLCIVERSGFDHCVNFIDPKTLESESFEAQIGAHSHEGNQQNCRSIEKGKRWDAKRLHSVLLNLTRNRDKSYRYHLRSEK